jgi:lysozyme-like protein
MADYSFSQLKQLWTSAGGDAAWGTVMAAIALAESSGNPDAINPTDNGGRQSSYGLWQISNGTHTPPAANWNDPTENARLANAKLKSQGLKAWGTYVSGAYEKFMPAGTSAPQVVANPGGGPVPGSSDPLAGVTGAVTSAGTLLHDAAAALDWFFHFFKPGQGWRIAFGAGGVLAAYGGIRSWQSASQADDNTAALPLAVLLFGLAAMAGFMTMRQWPTTSSGKPVLPGAYAVDIIQGHPPEAGARPGSDTGAIEVGLGALLALWGASKIAGGLGGLGGIIGDIGAFFAGKSAGGAPPVELPPVP